MSSDVHYLTQFETYLLTEKRVSQNTFVAYQTDIEQLLSFFSSRNFSVKKSNKQVLKKYVRELHKSCTSRTLARKISSIKLFYTFLSERYHIEDHAQALIFPKIEKKLPMYLTEDEIRRLLEAAKENTTPKGVRNLIMIHLLYASGMRISELVTLTTDQFHFDTGFLTVEGKGNKQRDIPLPLPVMETISYYIEHVYPKLIPAEKLSKNKAYLFATYRQGKVVPITRQALWGILRRILIAASITKPVSPHSLRHSLATHLLKAGADIRSLQLLLGHEQVNTVEIYTHLENKQVRKLYDKKHPRA